MIKTIEISVSPEKINNREYIFNKLVKSSSVSSDRITHTRLLRKSLDARRKIVYHLRYELFIDEPFRPESSLKSSIKITQKDQIHIIGAGPAGYFAALKALEHGMKPIIIERGKDVRARRRDLRTIQQESIVNPDSNYCFGEGGAGTFSDGKLYTRSHKRGPIRDVLRWLVEHGAQENIMTDAHPHIGSNRLPKIMGNIRNTIENHGGQIRFNTRLTNFIVEGGILKAIKLNHSEIEPVRAVILATGHSARDIFRLLHHKNLLLEAKDFALGVRIEHPQTEIDQLQYRRKFRGTLPPSAYNLNCKVRNRGVYSFCMCPGGLIVPAATDAGEIVLNGMSLSRRDTKFANSGIVTEIRVKTDLSSSSDGPLASLIFQEKLEKKFFQFGNGSQQAPAQNAIDFVNNRISNELTESSYIPGIYPAPLHELFPPFIRHALQQGLKKMNDKKKGFLSPSSQILAIESRTSSPVRIPRNDHFMHPQVKGLYPTGEGAGYAGGIMSAAIDGMRVADAIQQNFYNS